MNSPTTQEYNKLKTILNDLCEASGTTFNLSKSHLFFFNTPPAVQRHISRLLGIPRISLPSNYLNIPLSEAAAQNISWDALLSSLSNHLGNWTFRSLNIAARLVLIKFGSSSYPCLSLLSSGSPSVGHQNHMKPSDKFPLAWAQSWEKMGNGQLGESLVNPNPREDLASGIQEN
jgi:hypothetical protein